MPAQKNELKQITPKSLIPAMQYAAKAFDEDMERIRHLTSYLCHQQLQPTVEHPNAVEYAVYFALFQLPVDERVRFDFDDYRKDDRPPAVLKAFWDNFRSIVEAELRRHFVLVLEIGNANSELLNVNAIDWTKAQVQVFLEKTRNIAEEWLIDACDLDVLEGKTGTANSFGDSRNRLNWSAPKLTAMEPFGAMPYDSAAAWTREDANQTANLIASLTDSFVQGLVGFNEEMAGKAHMKAAKAGIPVVNAASPGKSLVKTTKKFNKAVLDLLRKHPEWDVHQFCIEMDRRALQHNTSRNYNPPPKWGVRSFLEMYLKRSNTVSAHLTRARKLVL